jgi:hypothetical protein
MAEKLKRELLARLADHVLGFLAITSPALLVIATHFIARWISP